MIFTIIDFALLLFSINWYNKKKYTNVIVAISYYASDAFLISFGLVPIIKHKDIGLILIIYCCYKGLIKNKKFFSIHNEDSGKINALLLIFIFIEFIYSTVLSVDSVSNIITVLRDYLYFLCYFIFRQCSNKEITKSFITISKFTVFSCILYIIQYFTHINLISTYIGGGGTGVYRMQITPAYIEFILLYLICLNKTIRFKWVIAIIIVAVLLLSLNRTVILGLVIQIGIFFIFSKNIKRKIVLLAISAILIPFVITVIRTRNATDNTNITAKEAYSYIRTNDYSTLAGTNTFYFRVACIAERVNYLLENKNKSFLGVGAIHENSKDTKQFHFTTGTIKRNNGYAEPSQLDTIDTTWSPIIIRFGFVGCFLFLYYLIYSMKLYYNTSENQIIMLGWIMIFGLIIQSISAGTLFFPHWIIQYGLLHAYRNNYLLQKKYSI